VETVLAWFWTPVVLYAIALGLGLLAERVARIELPGALLAPLGLAVAIVAVMPVYRLHGSAAVAAPLAVVLAAVGLALSRRSLRRRLRPGPFGLTALAAYVLYLAPVALSGHWTWGGYNFVNDPAINFVYVDRLLGHGMSAPEALDSTTAVITATGLKLGYPLGAHALLATLEPLSGAPLAAIYHPAIAAAAALAATSLAHIAYRAGLSRLAAGTAGLVAVAADLLYRYVEHGGIKEILVVALLATMTALGIEAAGRRLHAGAVALTALCAFPMVAVFSAAAGFHALVLGVLVLVAALLSPVRPSKRHVARIVGVGAAVALVAALPTLSESLDFGRRASEFFANTGGATTAYLGHLVRPLPLGQAAGVWLGRDYRYPVEAGLELPNSLLIAAVFAVACVGAVLEVRARRPRGLLLLGAAAAPAAVLAPHLSPYADAKLLVVLSPAIVLMAAIGAFSLIERARPWLRLAGVAAALVVVGGVAWSDVVGYREVRLAPPDRVEAMEDAARHAGGGGLWLVNEWEEYAKYFMRRIRVNGAAEAESPRRIELRRRRATFGRYFDLDEQRLDFVTGFPGIIKRRSPDASRPPASYEMVYDNDYYEVWRRRPGVEVVAHLPLQGRWRASKRPGCGAVLRLASRARAGERIVAARRPELALLDTAAAARSPGWVRNPVASETVVPTSPGSASGRAATGGGPHRVWVEATTGRPIAAYVDGRLVGEAQQVNTPGQWLEAGAVTLRPGLHRLELRRGGPSPAPGDAYRGAIGPLALEPVHASRLVDVPPRRAERLCGGSWDWIELVRGRLS